ncbi:hypothetical protein [Sphaerisporangium corydalis]|uniref:WD40 repeat domain-containing protein n=1 Tax=Sphaerisporangium corydalis TaxID=1441875 RepID=A0ABV9EH75_9ACTN|nr:hypothetical protein [Sphaerisporangium corydalis]
MNDELAETLRRTLQHASEQAPRAPGGLSARVVTRSRRRAARTQMAVAALAVAVVAGGVVVAARGGVPDPAPPAVETSKTPSAGKVNPPATALWSRTAPPAEKVWPDAVWKIPAKLLGGRAFQARAIIDDRTVLLETRNGSGRADALYAYDVRDRTSRKLTDVRTPEGVVARGYTAGAGRVFWEMSNRADGSYETTFWSVPVTGGRATAIGTDREVTGDGTLAVVGGRLAFSASEGGVFTIPLGGGTVEAVPGAGAHHILRWPWVARSDPNSASAARYTELLNAETGEPTEAVVHPGEYRVECGVTTCVGVKDGVTFHRLRDGSRERLIPALVLNNRMFADRFYPLLTNGRPEVILRDAVTGKGGDLGLASGNGPLGVIADTPVMSRVLDMRRADSHLVVDLARIR